jgi:hypothetical protein
MTKLSIDAPVAGAPLLLSCRVGVADADTDADTDADPLEDIAYDPTAVSTSA